jgi:DNA-binding transcriptional regulator YbjK
MVEEIALGSIVTSLQQLITIVAALRDDVNVLSAIVRRIDSSQGHMLDELRAMHAQYDRMANRKLGIPERDEQ